MTASYEKAICWIATEGRSGKRPGTNVNSIAGWRVTKLVAALFDRREIDVAYDVIHFAEGIDRMEHRP